MRTSRWTAALSAGMVVGIAVLLAGCSGGGGTSRAGAGSGGSVGSASAGPAASGRAAAVPVPAAVGGSARGVSTVAPLTTQAVIRTAEVTVDISRAQDVAARADTAGDLAIARGGRIDADRRTGGTDASATLVLRVPPADLPVLLRGLARLGHVTSSDSTAHDVTTQVADVTSRVASAQRAIARLRTLYADAPKVSDVIAIEQELSAREADLESVQAQQRTLTGQVSLATVTVSLRTAAHHAAARRSATRHGFLGGLANGWDAFVRAAGAVATGVGAALPFLALALLLGAVGRVVVLRRRRPVPSNG